MKKIKVITCIVALFSFISTFAQSPLDWNIKGESNAIILEDTKYGLWCKSEKDFLKAERRNYGVNLIWKTANPGNVTFKKKTGNGEIKSGEKVAIFLDGEKGGYLYYKKRKHGINLEFSKMPKYEWEIRNQDNKDGNSIKTNGNIALFSAIENDFIRGCKRVKPVINLAWSKDCVCISGDCIRKPVSNEFLSIIEKMTKKTSPLIL